MSFFPTLRMQILAIFAIFWDPEIKKSEKKRQNTRKQGYNWRYSWKYKCVVFPNVTKGHFLRSIILRKKQKPGFIPSLKSHESRSRIIHLLKDPPTGGVPVDFPAPGEGSGGGFWPPEGHLNHTNGDKASLYNDFIDINQWFSSYTMPKLQLV